MSPLARAYAGLAVSVVTLAVLSRTIDVQLGAWDKAAHGVAFALVAWVAFVVLDKALLPTRRVWLWVHVGSLCVLIACVDEWQQSYMAGRQSSVLDLLADVIGALVGLCAGHVHRRLAARATHSNSD